MSTPTYYQTILSMDVKQQLLISGEILAIICCLIGSIYIIHITGASHIIVDFPVSHLITCVCLSILCVVFLIGFHINLQIQDRQIAILLVSIANPNGTEEEKHDAINYWSTLISHNNGLIPKQVLKLSEEKTNDN